MTLWLARRVVSGVVDETSTTYLGTCDHADCKYLADHASDEVVEDALDGHRRRAHATLTDRTEDTTRTGWIPQWTYTPMGIVTPTAGPDWPPSPTPREES